MFWLTIGLFAAFLVILIPCILKLYREKKISRAKAAVSTCVFYFLLLFGIFLFRLRVPYWTILLTMPAAFINGFCGQYLGMYYRSIVFDRYLHAYGSFSFSLLFFYLLRNFLTISGSRLFLAVFVFLLGNTLGVLFELLEFSRDMRSPSTSKSQHGLKDTDMDMVCNLLGAFGAALLIYFIV